MSVVKIQFKTLLLTEDSTYIFTRNDDIYILSDEPTTHQQAERKCELYGGKIAQISLQERSFFLPHLRQKYIPGIL